MTESLPIIPIPLLAGDDDLRLDLQAVFTATYELLNYDLMVDYQQPPEISFSE